MNYTELCDSIADVTENTFTVDNYALFAQQSEQKIYNAVQLANLRRNSIGALTAANKYLSAPSDFLSTYSMSVINGDGDYSFLMNKDVNFIREAYPSASTTGLPLYYSQFDGDSTGTEGNFILGPTPDSNYDVELHYYYDPESIVTAGTSWYGDNAEAALLYGSLIEAYTYMKGEADLISLYTGRYNEAMGQLTGIDIRSNRDDYRDGKV